LISISIEIIPRASMQSIFIS